MAVFTFALLAAALAANPVPDNKSRIDTLSYTFGDGGVLGAGGSLSISADGKVAYFYSSAPFTGSGGRVVQKSWELSKEERTELFRKLVDDGLLEVEEGGPLFNQIRVTSGRWRATLAADKLPEKVMRHLRPLLAEADPVKWKEKPAAVKEPAGKPGVPTYLHYNYSVSAEGDHATLIVSRAGKVRYVRRPPAAAKPVEVEWTIPAKDAEALLDGLTADGLFDLEDAGGGKFPRHTIDAQVGRWRTSFHLKELTEKVADRLRPLLKKADPDFWK